MPRILELLRSDKLLWNLEITLGKLADNDFSEWPAEEQSAVNLYLHDWLKESVKNGDLDRFDSIVCGAAQLTDIEPFLEAAAHLDNTIAAKYLVGFARSDKRRLTNSFWQRNTANYDKVLRWAYEAGSKIIGTG